MALQKSVIMMTILVGIVQQTRLSEEEGFDLRNAGALLQDALEGQAAGEAFEGIAVDTEAEVTAQEDVEHLVPVFLILFQPAQDIVRLPFQPFGQQGIRPLQAKDGIDGGQAFQTGNGTVAGQEPFHVADHGFGYRKHQLGYFFPVPAENGSVILFHHMQDNVSVLPPVGCFPVNLHTARPDGSVQFDFRIEEVGSGICILNTRIQNFECIAPGCNQTGRPIEAIFPKIVK